MRAALLLEDIRPKDAWAVNRACVAMGERAPLKSRAWVARVKIDANGWIDRVFLKPGAMDYASANAVGSRGIMRCYWLEEMAYYEVSAPLSWRRTDRYFCEVVCGEIVRMTKEEVQDAQARTGS